MTEAEATLNLARCIKAAGSVRSAAPKLPNFLLNRIRKNQTDSCAAIASARKNKLSGEGRGRHSEDKLKFKTKVR